MKRAFFLDECLSAFSPAQRAVSALPPSPFVPFTKAWLTHRIPGLPSRKRTPSMPTRPTAASGCTEVAPALDPEMTWPTSCLEP